MKIKHRRKRKRGEFRVSKLKKVGDVVRQSMNKSSKLRGKYHAIKKANAEIIAAIDESTESDFSVSATRHCREAAQKMEDLLFSVGGAERIVTTLRFFKESHLIQELKVAQDVMNDDEHRSNRKLSKQERLNVMIIDSLKNFLGLFQRSRGDKDKGGGRRTSEDQNAYDAVLAALNSGELTSARMGRLLARTLNVSRRQIKQARVLRKNMEDMDKKRWVRQPSAVPSSAIREGKFKMEMK